MGRYLDTRHYNSEQDIESDITVCCKISELFHSVDSSTLRETDVSESF